MLHSGGVDETVFAQILNAYGALNPSELIPNDAYDACLATMGVDGKRDDTAAVEISLIQTGAELQQRFGAKLFVKERDDGKSILVSGTKKRNLELIPIRRVYATLKEVAHDHHHNATQLKHTIKTKVLGIPEEIVQEYCEMAISSSPLDDTYMGREKDEFKRCATCGVTKSCKSFAKTKDRSPGVRPRCKACDTKLMAEELFETESEQQQQQRPIAEEKPLSKFKKKKKESYNGLTGTAICAACGVRKPVCEFDKARQKPFTLKCRACAAINSPLMTKICCSCQLNLSLDHFYRDSYTKAGFRPRCMDCMKAQKGIVQMIPEEQQLPLSEPDRHHPDSKHQSLLDEPFTQGHHPQSSKSTRSQRDRRKSHKSRETDGMDALEEVVVEIPEPRRRFRKEKKTKQRRGRGQRQRGLSSEALGSAAHTKLVTMKTLAVRAHDERCKTDATVSGIEEGTHLHRRHSVANEARGLTGCSTERDAEGNVTKYCTGCQHFKKAEEFGRDVSKPGGLRSRCRQCQKRGRDVATISDDQPMNGISETASKKTPRKPIRKKTIIEEKVCARCDHQKPIIEFYRDKSKEDSYASICKRCAREAKARSEKSTAKKTAANTNNTFSKVRQGRVHDVEDGDIEAVMQYIDALAPESSAYSGEAVYDESGNEEMTSMAQHRICIGCQVDKNWIEFDRNPLLPDGLCPLCKECRRGNGLKGRRLSSHERKRRCLKCGMSRTAMQFAKTIFYPNRTSRICEKCREGDEREKMSQCTGTQISAKRLRLAEQHVDAMDLIDFESDLLRVQDPGGGELLWNPPYRSDSESDTPASHTKQFQFKNGSIQTQLKADGTDSVTVTHLISARCHTKQPVAPSFDPESISQAWNRVHRSSKQDGAPQILTKQCKRCGEMKSKDCYYVDTDKFSHLSSDCIQCCTATSNMAA